MVAMWFSTIWQLEQISNLNGLKISFRITEDNKKLNMHCSCTVFHSSLIYLSSC